MKQTHTPEFVSLIVEFPKAAEQDTLRQLQAIPGIRVGDVAFNMVRVTIPFAAIPLVEALPDVIVHYNAPVGLVAAPVMIDALLGQVSLSNITIPFSPQDMPARMASLGLKGIFSRQAHDPSVEIVTMDEVRKELSLPENNQVVNTKVAVLDTGVGLPHPALGIGKGLIKLGSTISPSPLDSLGHGSWVITAGFGNKARTRFGDHNGVADVKNGNLGSWKVLSDLGFGTSWSLIQGISQAVKWGAKILSLSLGSPQQGSVDDDPLVRIIESLKDEVIFVCAAGNDGDMGAYSINSPGIAPSAVTVGAYSSVYGEVSTYSSRGPSGPWYKDKPGVWRKDLAKHGDDLFKPDLVAPGGGPSHEGQKMDLILSGVIGWTQPMYVILPDAWGAMRGTSMSCPLAAGVIALAYEHGLIRTARDVKEKMAQWGGKDATVGYGMITYPKLI